MCSGRGLMEPVSSRLAASDGKATVVLSPLDGATFTHDPLEAVDQADAVYTDTWTSMGQEREAEKRRRDFAAYQINADLLQGAAAKAVVMHCLPAHRGEEITAEVIDGPQSIVFDQAENRLHTQKAIMVWLHEKMKKHR